MPRLTPEQQTLVLDNRGIAYLIAAEVYRQQGCRIPLDDLRSMAGLILTACAPLYDPTHPSGASFCTFASHYLRGRLLRAARHPHETGRMAKVTVRGTPRVILRTTRPRRYMRIEAMRRMAALSRQGSALVASLSAPAPGADHDLSTTIPEPPHDAPFTPDAAQALADALHRLKPSWAYLIRRHYLDEPPATLPQLAEERGVSRQAIGEQIASAMRHLRADATLARACGYD